MEQSLTIPFKWLILQTPCGHGCQFQIPQNNETEISKSDELTQFKCGHGVYKRSEMSIVGIEISSTKASEK